MGRIGVTIGDPAGIGPEIILGALDKVADKDIVLIGPREHFLKTKKILGIDLELPEVISTYYAECLPGKPSVESARVALSALKKGVELLKTKKIDALVTAPLSKEWIGKIVPDFSGHTRFLAENFGVKEYAMCGWSHKFKVVTVTEHIPYSDVPSYIYPELIFKKIKLFAQFLKTYLNPSPKIGVFGLNPHTCEFSKNEEERIRQAVVNAKREGFFVEGPLPADGLFYFLSEYDGFVAMYHDQAMIPVKLLSGGKGVNITIGMPFVRTSPLHGTAFDIAGKNVAFSESLEEAIKVADRLCKKRTLNF